MVKKSLMLSIACFGAVISNHAVASALNSDTHTMSPSGVNIITQLTNPEQVIYINANTLLEERNQERLNFDSIKNQVLKNKKKYLIDFSSIEDDEDKNLAFAKVSKVIGISFDDDFLIISAFNNSILYSPISSPEDPSLITVMERENTTLSKTTDKTTENLGSPVLSFYVEVNRPISEKECTFTRQTPWDTPVSKRVYCDSANISLIYQVEFLRSFAVRHGSNTTPDKKLVRIRLAGDATGSGIHLNDDIKGYYRYRTGTGLILDGWTAANDYDAIALDYKISVSADNNKAKILYKYPSSNVQSNYEHKEIEGFTIGGTTGGEIGKDGPKGKLEVTGSYESTSWLTYPTTDYAIKLSTPDNKTFITTSDREQFRDPSTLRKQHTSNALFQSPKQDILDKQKLKPIGYSNFTPQMEVFYAAGPDEVGTTDFVIDTSVQFSPIFFGTYRHYIGVGGWYSYQGRSYTPRRVHAKRTFRVDWQHPIFTGGNPVNLQVGSHPNRCITTNDNHEILLETCDSNALDQSFIYDELGRYKSTQNTSMCLDAVDLSKLAICTHSLSQRWKWRPGTDQLEELYSNQLLSASVDGKSLMLSYTSNSRVFTSYTNIYGTNNHILCDEIHEWSYSSVGQIGDLYLYRNPYTNTNDYFRLKKEHYGYFPIDQTSNSDWEFIGHELDCLTSSNL